MATLHELDIDGEGAATVRHPDEDVPDCGFDAYVERDWNGQPAELVARPSNWNFIRKVHESGFVDWLGTRLDTPPPLLADEGGN